MSRQFIRLKGVHFANPALPSLGVSTTEQLVAALPGLRYWLDPQTKFEPEASGAGLRDRIGLYDSIDYTNHLYSLNGAIGGQPTISFAQASQQGLVLSNPADFQFIENGYTIFVVMKKTQALAGLPMFAASGSPSAFIFSVSVADKLAIYHSASDIAAANAYTMDTNAHVLMAAWDAPSGQAVVEVDGVAQALNPDAILGAPVLDSVASFGIGTVGGVGTAANSSLGYLLLLDRSYARAAYTAQKKALLSALGTKYGIAVTV